MKNEARIKFANGKFSRAYKHGPYKAHRKRNSITLGRVVTFEVRGITFDGTFEGLLTRRDFIGSAVRRLCWLRKERNFHSRYTALLGKEWHGWRRKA